LYSIKICCVEVTSSFGDLEDGPAWAIGGDTEPLSF
jgi:hypothetical protein